MKIAVVGGGPGGLYFSLLCKKHWPEADIEIFERNGPDDSFGFGVVFSDETLSEFITRDERTYEAIRSRFAYWDQLDVVRNQERLSIAGNGFCGCSRKTLLNILQQRCSELGVKIHFNREIAHLDELEKADLIVLSDGINSLHRLKLAEQFGTQISMGRNRFVWLGSSKPLDSFTYFFKETQHGTIVAHTYQYQEGMSTWIFECTPETYASFGFEESNEPDTIEKLSALFKEELNDHALIPNKSFWRQFPIVKNKHWHYKNIVLLGDAKATAHFSIGSGTKLAMECAISLSEALCQNKTQWTNAFDLYERKRLHKVVRTQQAAETSMKWFENMDHYMHQPFGQFVFNVMTRSAKVSYENLKLRDQVFTSKVQEEFANQQQKPESKSPAFTPCPLQNLTLNNRLAWSAPDNAPTCINGVIQKEHWIFYGSKIAGSPALLISEAVYPVIGNENKATLIKPEQAEAWHELLTYIHDKSQSKMALRLETIEPNPAPIVIENSIKLAKQAGFDLIEFKLNNASTPLNTYWDWDGIKWITHLCNKHQIPFGIRISTPALSWSHSDQALFLSELEHLNTLNPDYVRLFTPLSNHTGMDQEAEIQVANFSLRLKQRLACRIILNQNHLDIDLLNTALLAGQADVICLQDIMQFDPHFVSRARIYENARTCENQIPNEYEQRWTKKILWEKEQWRAMRQALKPITHQKI